MTSVYKSPLPAHAHLWTHHRPGDFLDGYACTSPLDARTAAEIGMAMPGWAEALLSLRNRLVAPFGLRTDLADPKGGALFPVTYETPSEINLGFDDTHLNFRIALLHHAGQVHMSTWVHPHNAWGRAYLTAVMPFHILLTRRALKQIARASLAPT